MIHLGSADTITALMGGAVGATNPNCLIQYTQGGFQKTAVVALNGVTAVTLLTGSATQGLDTVLQSITISNVDNQQNVVTVTMTIGAVAFTYPITMAVGDIDTIDGITGKITGVNLSGQALTQTYAAVQQITSLTGATDVIPPHTAAQYVVNKAGVDAMTLAAPTATTDDGKQITVFSNTANAHTITATGLFLTGTASVNLATFANQKGAGLVLEAYQAKWVVISATGITFS